MDLQQSREKSMSPSSPSPISVGSATANPLAFIQQNSNQSSNNNPFSIDYILSSAVANLNQTSQQQKNNAVPNQSHEEQTTISTRMQNNPQTSNSQPHHNSDLANSVNQQSMQQIMTLINQHQHLRNNEQLTADFLRRRAEQQNQQLPPNIIYLMTYMLIQQQQQRQQQQIRPVESTPNPIDSLTLLADLTGQPQINVAPSAINQAHDHISRQCGQNTTVSKHFTNSFPINHLAQANFLSTHPLINQAQRRQTSMLGQTQQHNTPILTSSNQSESTRARGHVQHGKVKSSLKSNHNDHHPNTNTNNYQSHNNIVPNQEHNKFKLDSPATSADTTSNTRTSSSHHSEKPPHSYIGLIGMCILSSPEKRMLLSNIYDSILREYPYYRNRNSGWRNSVRHNLSLNECFQKSDRSPTGKGHYWTIHPANMEDFMRGDFRRRRAQRKVRRWNNMDVPSDESDDESIDVNKPPLPEYFKNAIEQHHRLEQAAYQTNPASGHLTNQLEPNSVNTGATTSQQHHNQSTEPVSGLIGSQVPNYLSHRSGSPLFMMSQNQQQALSQHSGTNRLHPIQLESNILMKRLNL